MGRLVNNAPPGIDDNWIGFCSEVWASWDKHPLNEFAGFYERSEEAGFGVWPGSHNLQAYIFNDTEL